MLGDGQADNEAQDVQRVHGVGCAIAVEICVREAARGRAEARDVAEDSKSIDRGQSTVAVGVAGYGRLAEARPAGMEGGDEQSDADQRGGKDAHSTE